MKQRHWFFFISHAILTLFVGIIVYVVIIAYSRRSGSTGLDMATIQKMRYDAYVHRSDLSSTTTQ